MISGGAGGARGPRPAGGSVAMGVFSSDGIVSGTVVFTGGTRGPVADGSEFLWVNRGEWLWLDLLEGTVLLRPRPPRPPRPDGTLLMGVDVFGVWVPPDSFDVFEETDTLRRRLPNFLTLSAPALAFEPDLPMTVLDLPGVAEGDEFLGVCEALCTSLTVFSSAAVPCIPIRKWSWFSMRKIKTS